MQGVNGALSQGHLQAVRDAGLGRGGNGQQCSHNKGPLMLGWSVSLSRTKARGWAFIPQPVPHLGRGLPY